MDLQRRTAYWYARVRYGVRRLLKQRQRLRANWALSWRRASRHAYRVWFETRRQVLPALADVAGRARACWDGFVGKTAEFRRLLPGIEKLNRRYRQAMVKLDASRLGVRLARVRTRVSSPHLEPRQQSRYSVEVAGPHATAVSLGTTAVVLLLVALPAFAGRDLLNDLIFVFTMLALAQCWNLLAGYAGLVSVGQQAFVGLGGYVLFALTIHVGLDALAAVLLAGLIAGLLALPTALVIFRLRGAHYAIGTWVMAEVYRLVFAQIKQLGGGTGMSLPPFVTNEVAGIEWIRSLFDVRTAAARDILSYWSALALAAVTILLAYLVLRSRHGLALAAIRDSEIAAESVGVDNYRTKLWVYIVTAAATGVTGALLYLQKARISPDAAFSVLDWTAYVIFIVVIGGIGTIEGPIVGVLVFYVLQTNLAHFGSWYLMLLGGFAILVMLFAPRGIWGYLSETYGLTIFSIRRRLHLRPQSAEPKP
jgi:branched-chain amino acid transport system permease protein